MHRRLLLLFLLFSSSSASTAILWACSSDDQSAPPEPDAGFPNREPFDSGSKTDAPTDAPAGPTYKARAAITPTSLPDAGAPTGTLDLVQTGGNVHVTLTMMGATAGMHGVHIHDGTSCADTTNDGAVVAAGAAGGHWDPGDAGAHGFPTSAVHHPGDFGNVTIAGDGTGTLTLDVTGFNVQADGGIFSALGHAVIFHQGTDDGVTQPTGNAGTRAGCGLIQAQ